MPGTSTCAICDQRRAAQLLFGSVVGVQLLNLPALVFRYMWDMPGATAYLTFFAVSDEGKVPTFVSGVTILIGAALAAWPGSC